MANTIRIKRRASSGSSGAPSSLKNAELAFNEADNILYYGFGDDGNGDATSITSIGGTGAFATLGTTQTISGAKTFSGTVSLGSSATASTQSAGDNSTSVATTAYVDSAVTAANYNFTISDGVNSQDIDDANTLTFSGGTGVTTTVGATDTVTFAIGQSVGTSDDVTFNTVTADVTGDLTGTADVATSVTATANNATDETTYLTFVDGATGTQGIETDTGLTYNPSSGILTTTSVSGNLTGNVTGNVTGDVTGNADTATALATGRTIALSGDVTATGVSFDGSANITLSTTIAANSVALGTDTTGDYVESLVAGTGVTLSDNSGEGATPTVAIGQAVGTSDNVTFNDVTVSGDLTVSGNTTTVNTATLSVEDPLIILANGNNAADAVDIGFYGLYDTSGSQDLYAGLFRDASDGKFRLFKDTQAAPTTTVDTSGTGYTVATLVANVEGGTVSSLSSAIAVGDGGTGATTASGARTNLGVAIGSDVQAHDAGLDDISGLAVTDGNIIVGDGSNWVAESGATARASLGVSIGSDVQAYDADLSAIAGLANTDGNFIVGNGSTWVVESGSTARSSLGLGSIATQAASSVAITGGAVDGTTIGATTASTGAFTTLTASGATTLTANTTSSSYTTGTLVVTGGVGISGALYGNSSTLSGFDVDGGTF